MLIRGAKSRRALSARASRGRLLLQDALLAGVVVAGALAQLLVPVHLFVVPGAAALAAAFVAMTLRRVWVPGALGALLVLAVVESYVYGDRLSPLALAYMIVLGTAAASGSRVLVGVAGFGAAFGGFYAAWALSFGGGRYGDLLSEPTEVQAVALFAPAVVLVSAWLVGVLVRLRRTNRVETALRERAQVHADRAEEAARFERLRADIARDVHDVVGHALTVVIAQSDLASFVDDVDRLHDITATIGTTARSSMREIRDVLDDTEEVARPGSRQETVAALVGELRGAGVDVRRTVDGVPTSVPDRSGIVIRRIVQEMLTNAVRHGVPATPVLLRERWSPEMLVIEAQNQIADEPDSGGGRGIPGIRTRLAAISGDVEIERADGVFRIRVHVPLTASTSGRAE